MTKFIPYIAILCGFIFVIFLTDFIEGRGIIQGKKNSGEEKNDNESGRMQLKRRDERLLSAHIKVTRCRNQGCRSPLEKIKQKRHKRRHRHGKTATHRKDIGKKTAKRHRKDRRKGDGKNRNKNKTPKTLEDVMQSGGGVGGRFTPSRLDPEEIMQNGEAFSSDRYDIASYDQYYAGYGRRRFGRLQRPPEADRLERRLHPNFATAAYNLLSSIDRVTLALKSNIQQMHDTYDFAFNSTRYTMMMGVREELTRIAASNNMVYDVVMDISLLTKDIYMRAHRRGLTRPTTRVPEMPDFRSFSEELNKAKKSQRLSKKQHDQAQEMMDECQRQNSYLEQIKEKMSENKNKRELIDLIRHVNMTVRKLQNEFDTAMVVRKLNRHMFVSGESTFDDIQEATELVRDAKLALRAAAQNSRGNAIAYEEWHRKISGDNYTLAPVSYTDRRSRPHKRHHSRHKRSTISPAERARLRPIINRAVEHAQKLGHLAKRIDRVFQPLLKDARPVITGGDGQVSYRVQASLLADKLMTDIQNIRIALDRIRIAIYNEDDLRLRCEELTEGSAYDDETSPIDCDDFLETGSGNITDIITSPDPDEDSDFTFDGEKIPEKHTGSNVKRFEEKLRLFVVKLEKSGEVTLRHARTASEKTKEMSTRWSKAKANLGSADIFASQSATFLADWNREQSNVDKISEKVKSVHEKVDFIYNITQSKTFQAVLKAEKKLSEVRGQSDQGLRGTTDDNSGGSSSQDLAAAIQATNTAKNTTRAIVTFNRAVPSLVAGVEQKMNDIRDKISSLRNKVDKARLVLSSMQVSINKQDDGYLPLPLTSSDESPTLHTTVELCMRPEVTDGPVLLVTGNNAESYSLSMAAKKLKMRVYDIGGYEIGDVDSNIDVDENKWYSVFVHRIGNNVSLTVRPEGEEAGDTVGSTMKLSYTQPSPLTAYLGGAPDTLPMSVGSGTWKGCVGGLRVNGWSVGLLQKSSESNVPLPCTSHCSPAPASTSMVFEGDGYVQYPVNTVPLRYPIRSVYFEFRTRQEDAFLITVVKRGFQLRAQLIDGTLVIETTTPSEDVVLRSQNSRYNDGVFHTLKIVYRDSTTYPEIDGKDGLFSIEPTQPGRIHSPADGIVIGGMPEEHKDGMGGKFRPLIGCMRKLQINDVTMTMAEVERAHGVHVGSCSKNNMWLGCVEFVNTSAPIAYGTTEDADTVVIVVTRGSSGPFLQYQKGDNFNAIVSMKRDGIEIYESVKDFNGKLRFSEEDNSSFVAIKITDASNTVTFEYLDDQASFSYGGAFSWLGGGDDSPYTLTVGGQEEDSDMPPFTGGVAQLLVGKRYVEMKNYIDDNKLTSCSRRYDPSSTTSSSTLASRRR